MKQSILIFLLLLHIAAPAQDTIHTLLMPVILLSVDPHRAVYVGQNPGIVFDMPIVRKNVYSEIRFNYDAANTAGLYLGRIWSWRGKVEQAVIPQLGLLLGDFMGMSVQVEYKIAYMRLDFDLQNQYSVSINKMENFYFNWSSLQYKLGKGFIAGASAQTTLSKSNKESDVGYLIGYQRGKWGLAVFHFNFYKIKAQYFYLGLQIRV